MFIWSLWRWLVGWVRFEAEGGLPERLLNLASARGLDIWHIAYPGGRLSARCRAREYHMLRPLRRKTGMRIRLREKHGLPFLLHRYRTHGGIAVGMAAAICLLLMLSSRIWVVEVRATKNAEPYAITAGEKAEVCDALKGLGVDIGNKSAALDMRYIRMQGIARLPEVNWLSVNLEGSTAYIDVELLKDSVPRESTEPSNLVAAVEGRILSMEVTGGRAMVKVGDGVAAGTLLVSGAVETTAGTLLRRSTGRVLAETHHTLCVRVPLEEELMLPDGRVFRQASLRFFGMTLPLSANISPDRLAAYFYTDEQQHPWVWRDTVLPVGLTDYRIVPLMPQTVTRTPEEARALARARLDAERQTALSAATITASVETEELRDGWLVLTAALTCTENIGREVPLLVSPST